MMARMAMMNAHSMLFSLVCPCECVLYPIRQPVSTLPSPLHVPVTPHPTDVLLFATVENGVAVVTMPDADVPACAPMPHGDCLVGGLGPCRDWCGCCDYVLHCVALVCVLYSPIIVYYRHMSSPNLREYPIPLTIADCDLMQTVSGPDYVRRPAVECALLSVR